MVSGFRKMDVFDGKDVLQEKPKLSIPNLSFGFSKKIERKKLGISPAAAAKNQGGVAENEVLKRKKSGRLVIPLPVRNDTKKEVLDPLTENAAKELEEESKRAMEEIRKRAISNDGTAIVPLLSGAKDPLGSDATNDDYEEIPVEAFGLAMLRGMGLKEEDEKAVLEGEGDRLLQKASFAGVGLGSSASKPGGHRKQYKKGDRIVVHSGRDRGKIGEIQGFDLDAARVVVKLEDENKTISLPELTVELSAPAPKKEADKDRILNAKEVDEYKRRQEEKHGDTSRKESRSRSSERQRDDRRDKHGKDEWSRQGRSRSPIEKKKKRRDDSPEAASPPPSKPKRHWARPSLRVRIVDEKFMRGRYHLKKAVVIDVITPETCCCKADSDGRLLENVPVNSLETVIPKTDSSVVMILRGKAGGKRGKILKRDPKRFQAMVQVVGGRDVLTLDYEDVCEYVA